ncbi:MAG: phytanoyl-CoA dioxygenase family protein [Planctomycetota bacterium]|nr:phytanoyl-CoA dioxygenase family protein [Planctomycetota bacterium]
MPTALSNEISQDVDAIIDAVNEKGFCVVPDVISVEKADQARQALMHFVEEEMTDEHRQSRFQRVGKIAVKDPVFLELMCHPLSVEVWRRMLGRDMVCSTWTGCTLHPGWDKYSWHVDYPYWSIQAPYPKEILAGQTVWLLDNFTNENGGTGAIPGSHLRGEPVRYKPHEWPEEAENITGKRGSVVFAHGAWWHCSRPNQTDQPRSCLLGMFIRKCCIPQEDMRRQLDEIVEPSELVTHLMCGKQHQPRTIGEY